MGSYTFDLSRIGNDFIYFHDLDFSEINPGIVHGDSGGTDIIESRGQYIAGINNRFRNVCCTVINNRDNQFALYRHNSVTLLGQDSAGIMHNWNAADLEFVENYFDANAEAWRPPMPGGNSFAMHAHSNCQRVVFRRNTVINFEYPGMTASWTNSTRPTDDIVYDANYIELNHPGVLQPKGFSVHEGHGEAIQYVEDVTFTNNILVSKDGAAMGACLVVWGGNDAASHPGTVTYAGNTCIGADQAVDLANRDPFVREAYRIESNIFSGMVTSNIAANYGPGNLVEDGNVYTPAGDYSWEDSPVASLDDWKTSSANTGSISRECEPLFVDEPNGDYHLDPSDTCATGAGVDITGITPFDHDGAPRSTASPSAGAFVP
jgi:hypothetical protein